MKVEKKPINFEDERGTIRDILTGEEVNSVTIITCKAGSVRGNHFHKKTNQYTYIVSGKVLFAAQESNGPVETRELTAGDLVFSPPGEKHALKALEDSIFLSLNKGLRQGKDYEKDTYRLEEPILS